MIEITYNFLLRNKVLNREKKVNRGREIVLILVFLAPLPHKMAF